MTTLVNLVKGIRQNRGKESEFIGLCLNEIRMELSSRDGAVKANALRKLSYVSVSFFYDAYTLSVNPARL